MHETVHFVIIIIFDNCRDPTQVLAIIKRTGPDLTRKRENNKRKNEERILNKWTFVQHRHILSHIITLWGWKIKEVHSPISTDVYFRFIFELQIANFLHGSYSFSYFFFYICWIWHSPQLVADHVLLLFYFFFSFPHSNFSLLAHILSWESSKNFFSQLQCLNNQFFLLLSLLRA